MIIEILYSDYLIFGDGANVDYIEKCLPEAEFIYTSIHDTPYFAENEPDLIYMGAMSENNQERVIKALIPYKHRLDELIEKGVHILFTSTACDVLGKCIVEDNRKVECLGIFDFTVKVQMLKRFNAMTLGNYNGIEMLGFKSQFGVAYPEGDSNEKFFDVTRGAGLNRECKWEGFKRNNLIATYIIGPFLVLNPIFTKQWLSSVAKREVTLPFEDLAMQCYRARLEEFKDENRNIE